MVPKAGFSLKPSLFLAFRHGSCQPARHIRPYQAIWHHTLALSAIGGLLQAVAKPIFCHPERIFVILNEVKDLELVEKTRFFAPLRMTRSQGLGFCNSFYPLLTYGEVTPLPSDQQA
jgi:hypothetical protein